MVSHEKIIETVKGSAPHDEGADARYWHIPGTEWGVKLFGSEYQRDVNYERQAEGYANGVAPALGDKIRVGFEFGFVTEHIPVLGGFIKENMMQLYNQLVDTLHYLYEEDMTYDLHIRNWGLTKYGQPVMIDFSRLSNDDMTSSGWYSSYSE